MWESGFQTRCAASTGAGIVDWAQRAERAGFSSLGTLDRLVYPKLRVADPGGGGAGLKSRLDR